ncbi:MAG: SAM-dependent methyltransferase [Promethearchaeati archaeon]
MTSDDSHRHKRDKHYKKAKKEGYRARSAYKLIDIQNKFNIFKRAFYILDIGSAPGSWLQVARKYAEENIEKYRDKYYHRNEYRILGVDINKVSPIENVETIKLDATKPEFKDKIISYFGDKLDLLLSDASINKSGNKFADHVKQIRLCYHILDLGKEFLKYKGNMVIKCFQGTDFKDFYDNFKKEFKFGKAYKPKASKKKSNEIYLIGIDKI